MSKYFVIFHRGPRDLLNFVKPETAAQSVGCPQKHEQRARGYFSTDKESLPYLLDHVVYEVCLSEKDRALFYDLDADSRHEEIKKQVAGATLEHTVQREFETFLVTQGFKGYFHGKEIISFVELPIGKPKDAKIICDWSGKEIKEDDVKFTAAGNLNGFLYTRTACDPEVPNLECGFVSQK